jgi:hypothetical protein
MDSLLRFFKGETPAAAPLRPPLEEQEVYNIVQDFLTEGIPNPTNQQIADKLGRNVEEVTKFRPIGEKLPRYYDDDYGKTVQESLSSRAISPETVERMQATVKRMQKTDPIRAKYLNALVLNNRLQLGGRRTNKNKKKHKKISRQRRHHSKKNRKSMKRK